MGEGVGLVDGLWWDLRGPRILVWQSFVQAKCRCRQMPRGQLEEEWM